MTTTIARRTLLGALSGAGCASLFPRPALALSRSSYGGDLRVSLPLRLSSLDPHDPEDLAAALLGSSVFDALYATTSDGRPYPALAAAMPQASAGRLLISLRPGLTFSDGSPLDASTAVAALKRSQRLSRALHGLPDMSPRGSLTIACALAASASDDLARSLANTRAALVPKTFNPQRPIGTGAMEVMRTGRELRLKRNPRAARGASFLETATIKSASVPDCLRAFEARQSDLGFLGAGLHHMRQDVGHFQMKPLGLVLVQAGSLLTPKPTTGTLHEALARLPVAPFSALGVERPRHTSQGWNERALSILVSRDEPWLVNIASELAEAWSSERAPVTVDAQAHDNVRRLRETKKFSLVLRALATSGIDSRTLANELFAIDGRTANRGGRILSPWEAGRQLDLGVLGELAPKGALSPLVSHLVSAEGMTLQSAELRG